MFYWLDVHLDKKDLILDFLQNPSNTETLKGLDGHYLGTNEQGTAGEIFLELIYKNQSFHSKILIIQKKMCFKSALDGCADWANFMDDKILEANCGRNLLGGEEAFNKNTKKV